jgi:hypothetical protein
MTSIYRICLQNQSTVAQKFWCFLAPPGGLGNYPEVYANSSISLSVQPYSPGLEFVIPAQYVVGGASIDVPVGPGVEILSQVVNPVSPGDAWEVSYVDAPPKIGPTMVRTGAGQEPGAIEIVTNGFDANSNQAQGWFSSLSFGIQTDAGFTGLSWSPGPNERWFVTPELVFYVTVGSFGDNQLAGWDEVSSKAAVIAASSSFDVQNRCTVTYTDRGRWTVNPGDPANTASPPA